MYYADLKTKHILQKEVVQVTRRLANKTRSGKFKSKKGKRSELQKKV